MKNRTSSFVRAIACIGKPCWYVARQARWYQRFLKPEIRIPILYFCFLGGVQTAVSGNTTKASDERKTLQKIAVVL